MKSIKIFAMAAIAALALSSCSKEDNSNAANNNKGLLVIKLDGVNTPETRAIDNPGSNAEGTITLGNGWVFVFNSDGTLYHDEALDLTDAQATGGQLLMENTDPLEVTGDMKVYIVGNLPVASADAGAAEAARLATIGNTNGILAASKAIGGLQVANGFKTIPLANHNGLAAIAPAATQDTSNEVVEYETSIALKPLLSRLELAAIQAKTTADNLGIITAFVIDGIYIDSYYDEYTYGGSGTGTLFDQQQSTTFSGLGDGGDVAATDASPYIAYPIVEEEVEGVPTDVRKAWAYNVPSKGAARLIIHLKSVTYTPTIAEDPEQKPRTLYNKYLTVGTYMDGETKITDFARGVIYRIGTEGENEFEFGPENLDDFPNPSVGTLTVKVTVDEWTIKYPDAGLM